MIVVGRVSGSSKFSICGTHQRVLCFLFFCPKCFNMWKSLVFVLFLPNKKVSLWDSLGAWPGQEGLRGSGKKRGAAAISCIAILFCITLQLYFVLHWNCSLYYIGILFCIALELYLVLHWNCVTLHISIAQYYIAIVFCFALELYDIEIVQHIRIV